MTERQENYPPPEPEGTQPTFPQEGIPPDPIVGNKAGTREDEDRVRESTDKDNAGSERS